jgi:hypothetical protein
MRKNIAFTIITLFVVGVFACNKDKITNDAHGKLEFYLISDFDTLKNTFMIDISNVILADTPLIKYDDIVSYNSNEYAFKISNNAKLSVKNLKHSVHGLAFAVVANNEKIYAGYFWSMYSSLSCDWIVVDPILVEIKSEMQVKLGYPGQFYHSSYTDNRNDNRIIEILKRDNKLVE